MTLERAAWAPAPGQAAVFYRDDEVIGGGRIAASEAATADGAGAGEGAADRPVVRSLAV